MKITIKKGYTLEYLIVLMFIILPFTRFFNFFVFGNKEIMGLGILNICYYLLIILVLLDACFNYKKYDGSEKILAAMFVYFAFILFKIGVQNCSSNFIIWAKSNQNYLMLPFILIVVANKKLDIKQLIRIMVYVSPLICFISMFLFLNRNYYGMVEDIVILRYSIVGTPFSRMMSVFASPNIAGMYFALILVFAHFELEWKKVTTKFIIVINILCLVLTFSRMAFIAYVCVFLYKNIFLDKKKYTKWLILGGVAVGIPMLLTYMVNAGIYFWRIEDFVNNVRWIKWRNGIEAIKDHIVLGNPFELYIQNSSFFVSPESDAGFLLTLSDNSVLFLIAYFGIVMFIIFAFVLIRAYLKLRKEVRKYVLCGIILIGLTCMLADYVQLFPVNYLALVLLRYLKIRGQSDSVITISN